MKKKGLFDGDPTHSLQKSNAFNDMSKMHYTMHYTAP